MKITRDFSGGKLNRDLDPRYIQQGDYINAENVRVVGSDGNNVGVVENMEGTQLLESIPAFPESDYKLIGFCSHNDYLYYVATNLTEAKRLNPRSNDGTLIGRWNKTSNNHQIIIDDRFAPSDAAPVVPVNISFSNITPNSITISWNAVANATSYTVEWYIISAMTNTQTVTDSSITISGLTQNTVYFFRVRANNNFGSSVFTAPSAQRTSIEASLIPSVPTNIRASVVGIVGDASIIQINWDESQNAEQYTVVITRGDELLFRGATADTSIRHTGIGFNTEITIIVAAFSSETKSEDAVLEYNVIDPNIPLSLSIEKIFVPFSGGSANIRVNSGIPWRVSSETTNGLSYSLSIREGLSTSDTRLTVNQSAISQTALIANIVFTNGSQTKTLRVEQSI